MGTADGKRGAVKSGGGRMNDLCLLFSAPLMVCLLLGGGPPQNSAFLVGGSYYTPTVRAMVLFNKISVQCKSNSVKAPNLL